MRHLQRTLKSEVRSFVLNARTILGENRIELPPDAVMANHLGANFAVSNQSGALVPRSCAYEDAWFPSRNKVSEPCR